MNINSFKQINFAMKNFVLCSNNDMSHKKIQLFEEKVPYRMDFKQMPKSFALFFDETPKNRFNESFELIMALPIFKEENNHKFDKK